MDKLKKLSKKLEGSSFDDRLERYVKMNIFRDKIDDVKDDNESRLKTEIKKLANDSLKDLFKLKDHFTWLQSSEAKNASYFGYYLGQKDKEFKVWDYIKINQKPKSKGGNSSFLSSYLKALKENSSTKYFEAIDYMINQGDLVEYLPDVIWRAGLDEKSIDLYIKKIDEKIIPYQTMNILAFGSVLTGLNTKIIHKLLDVLESFEGIDAASIAVSIVSHYEYYKDIF